MSSGGSSSATMEAKVSSSHKRAKPHKVHYGLATVSDGKCRPQSTRLKLMPETLVLQREEFLFPDDDDGYPVDNKLRIVKLKRQPDGSLGISIKGGSDYNLPILVSKVCRNEDDDHLYIGDAIIKVNSHMLLSCTHDEAVHALRDAGSELNLTVKHYRSAAPFLLRNLRLLIPETEQFFPIEAAGDKATACDEASSSNSQTDPSVNGNLNRDPPECRDTSSGIGVSTSRTPVPILDSPCSVASDCSSNWNGMIPKVRRKWVDVVEVPLLMAYLTRYIFGTDKLRPSSFEVRGMNGANTGVIHISNLALLSNWIKLITDNISILNGRKAVAWNRASDQNEQITYLNWMSEGILNRNQPWQNWKPKFFALKGSNVYIFDSPPAELGDWQEPNATTYKIFESMFRVIRESENVDERQHCFLIQTACGQSRYFSMETRQDLLRLESAWHRAVCQTVSQMGSTTFHVVYKNLPAALTLDWTDGFLLKPFAASSYVFNYNFSQLKGSSDDGHATLKLQFRQSGPSAQDVVEHELICPKLQELLFFMHAFLTAKVASVDPSFMVKVGSSHPAT